MIDKEIELQKLKNEALRLQVLKDYPTFVFVNVPLSDDDIIEKLTKSF